MTCGDIAGNVSQGERAHASHLYTIAQEAQVVSDTPGTSVNPNSTGF